MGPAVLGEESGRDSAGASLSVRLCVKNIQYLHSLSLTRCAHACARLHASVCVLQDLA